MSTDFEKVRDNLMAVYNDCDSVFDELTQLEDTNFDDLEYSCVYIKSMVDIMIHRLKCIKTEIDYSIS